MSKYRRWRAGSIYFFTVVTHERRPILTTDLGRECLRTAFKDVRQKFPFETIAIVLLPDHLHAIWELPHRENDYSKRWRRIKGHFTRNWIAEGGQNGSSTRSRQLRQEQSVWQRRFFEHMCRDEADLKRCLDYVHVNPVKHKLAPRVRDWPWSSFHRYVRLGEYDPNWGSSDAWYGDEFSRFE
ncbi:transposase [Blastopirellula sp. J2-11]|uniref:REP-associated tyrosine transposase n=1 Tax=Blastopirellula sp. J2-11 TaxID=2943192 RepID=UPI0021C7760D|nr:transposase [Blastopirellula sp. J2-11]UUO07650.1 transposase [Blastopirellula sp. J2-11]